MSYNTWPTFAGRGWNIKKRPITRTIVQQADGGQEFRLARYQNPLYEFDIEIPYLSQADYIVLQNFFWAQQGSLTPFWFSYDGDVANKTFFGTGDGSTRLFTLDAMDGSPVDYVLNSPSPTFYAGSSVVPGTLTGNNQVTLTTAPSSGASLYWTGSYARLVRFADDKIEVAQTMNQIYEATTITLRSVR